MKEPNAMADILDALKSLAADQPEKAVQVLDDLRMKWSSMTDEQKAQAKEQLGALTGKIAGLAEDQRRAIADKIASLG
jgi:hypothetical protein